MTYIEEAIVKLSNNEDLTFNMAKGTMDEIMNGKATNVQISSYLNIMTNLDIKNNIINDIISEFKYYYDLDQDVIQEFNKIIENIKDNNNNFELKNKIDNII